jgi:hypothetical protein
MMDVQLSHAIKFAIPDGSDSANEGWYLNMGEKAGVTEGFFTIADLIAAHGRKPPKLPGVQ